MAASRSLTATSTSTTRASTRSSRSARSRLPARALAGAIARHSRPKTAQWLLSPHLLPGDLRTHVAIANEVQTLGPVCSGAPDYAELDGGRWLAINGRILFKAVVTGSETYNTALETRLRDDLDLRFQDRTPDALSGATPGPTAAGDSRGGCARGSPSDHFCQEALAFPRIRLGLVVAVDGLGEGVVD